MQDYDTDVPEVNFLNAVEIEAEEWYVVTGRLYETRVGRASPPPTHGRGRSLALVLSLSLSLSISLSLSLSEAALTDHIYADVQQL